MSPLGLLLLVFVAGTGVPAVAGAQAVGEPVVETPDTKPVDEPEGATAVAPEAEDVVPEPRQTGRDIYARVLENRFRTTFEKRRMVSADAAGGTDETEMWLRWKDGRDEAGEPQDGVLEKLLIKYTEPHDVRGAGYLVIQKVEPPHDQFVYLPAVRKVKRVALSDAILGTDFALEDVVPRDIESSDYRRIDDETVEGRSCYVVEVIPKPEAKSGYSRLLVYVDPERYVVLRARYWDEADVEVKRLDVNPDRIEKVKEVFVPTESRMESLVDGTWTTTYVDDIDPDAAIRDSAFSVRNLERKSR